LIENLISALRAFFNAEGTYNELEIGRKDDVYVLHIVCTNLGEENHEYHRSRAFVRSVKPGFNFLKHVK